MVTTSISSSQTSSCWRRTRHSGTPSETRTSAPASARCGSCRVVDRAFLQRRLSAVGELLPEGAAGCGVALSLFKRKKLEARGTLWEKPAVRPNPGADDGPSVVARYYGLAAAAAAWVQFEASRVLDDRVGLITSSAESFSLLSAGIDEHRAAASTQEPKRYRVAAKKYTEALKIDRENVAALVNLSVVDARRNGNFAESIQKLERARSILERRYMESAKTRKAISKRPELADPTWYRIRYGLASQQLHARRFVDAERDVLELIASTSAVLTEIGWRWTGRQPTWFTSWYKRAPARLWRAVRRLAGRARRRSVVGDWELARFLAHTVEPAAVALWWSTRVAQGSIPRTPEESDRVLRPLDRRREKDDDWLEGYLEELVTEQPDRRNLKRLFGWLGVSRWRPPDEPNDRAHYNLACLFSRLAEQDVTQRDAHLERSASHLERCLAGEWGARRGASAGWAARDPGLSGLRGSTTRIGSKGSSILKRKASGSQFPSHLRDASAQERRHYHALDARSGDPRRGHGGDVHVVRRGATSSGRRHVRRREVHPRLRLTTRRP